MACTGCWHGSSCCWPALKPCLAMRKPKSDALFLVLAPGDHTQVQQCRIVPLQRRQTSSLVGKCSSIQLDLEPGNPISHI